MANPDNMSASTWDRYNEKHEDDEGEIYNECCHRWDFCICDPPDFDD